MATTNRVLGGGNRTQMFSLTDGGSPTIGSSPIYDYNGEIVSVDVQRQESNEYKITVDGVKDDATLNTYLETYMNNAVSSGREAVTFEDGTKEEAATSTNATQLIIAGGGLIGGTVGQARKVFAAGVRLDGQSGSYKQEGEKWNRVSLAFTSFKLGGSLTIGSSYFSAVATTPAPLSLTSGFPYGRVAFM